MLINTQVLVGVRQDSILGKEKEEEEEEEEKK